MRTWGAQQESAVKNAHHPHPKILKPENPMDLSFWLQEFTQDWSFWFQEFTQDWSFWFQEFTHD